MRSRTPIVLAAVVLSWLGFLAHNLADLPGQTPLSPESAYPTLVYVLLAAAWFTPARRITAWLLLGWGLLHLVGGAVISVPPIPILPFDPAQTLHHYLFHAIYGVTQIPLLVVSGRDARHRL